LIAAPLSHNIGFSVGWEMGRMIDSSFCFNFLIDPDGKVTKTVIKQAAPLQTFKTR
jgi:hypothetical protein